MKTIRDLIIIMISGEYKTPMRTIPKTVFDVPKLTTTGRMLHLSVDMVSRGDY
ncbi:MAG: hypothetical protein J6S85_26665 [Methanobrevibacter sp.]|nr:hypothetical protein [Methanobrevibacter sp.]MBO7717178.1 hypothetical protein [Methanobrevibacter sp.]